MKSGIVSPSGLGSVLFAALALACAPMPSLAQDTKPAEEPKERADLPEAKEIIARYIEAKGGEKALKKRTLTKLYNERPTWLANAHKTLDQAVFAAYGWNDDPDDAEILARLLALNLAREAVGE